MESIEELTKNTVKPRTTLKPPPLYKVIYVNDNITSMEFVISSLMEVFGHSPETAAIITNSIHEKGSGVAAILPYEMAEQKGVEATHLARAEGFPLQIKLEPE